MPESGRWWEFEQFVREILQGTPGIEIPDRAHDIFPAAHRKELGFDIEAVRDHRPLLVEIKSQTPQTGARLSDILSQMREGAARYEKLAGPRVRPQLLAVFPGVLSPRKRVLSRQDDVEIWDGRHLRRRAHQLGLRVPAFVAVLEGEETAEAREPADELTRRLMTINPGRAEAPAYEKWCQDVLSFLFAPPLNPPIVQRRDDMGANRRDLIMPNYATRGFWHFMRNRFAADYVVAEAKNLNYPANKLAVLQLANYLSRHGTGLFGMLLTRRGLNGSAKWTRREHWVLHDKMIIDLDDEDMKQMLLTKLAGNDPEDLIQQRIEDFRLRI